MSGPPTGESVLVSTPVSTSLKRKTTALRNTGGNEEPASKRNKGEALGVSTRSGEHGEEDVFQPPAIAEKHPVNVQNGIYAAERLSCSLEITHSINFILRGEIHPPRHLIHDSP